MSGRVRFDSLDAVRGLGALVVVFWHWQHMLLVTGPKFTWPPVGGADHRVEPFYAVLSPFYDYGFRAVDLFFVISGFVFYLLYERSIAEGRIRPREFFILRLSRLYPLHFLTLLLVAALQAVFWLETQQTFVYVGNTVPNFIGNLLLVNAPHYSFNGPTWALTVEALLYLLFWPLARTGVLKGWIATTLLTVLGIGLLLIPEWSVWGRGIAGFFAGGLACRFYVLARERRMLATASQGLAIAGWVVTLWICYARPAIGAGLSRDANFTLQLSLIWSMFYILFPLSVVALALWDEQRAKPIPAFAWLGTTSYSAYVLHFPMQLIIAIAVVNGLAPATLGQSGFVLIAFLALLLVLARFVYNALEEPLQRWFRRTFLPAPPAVAPALP